MTEYVLYATKKGKPSYMEEIIAVDNKAATDAEMVEIKRILTAKGYTRIRVAAIDLSVAPVFGRNVLNV